MNNPVFYAAIGILVIGNVFLLVKAVDTFRTYYSSQGWIIVEGTIVSSELQKVATGDRSGATTYESYEAIILYRYKVAGLSYVREVVRKAGSREEAEAYKKNDTAMFFCDPNKPEITSDDRKSIVDLFGVIAAILVLNGLGIALILQIYSFFTEEL